MEFIRTLKPFLTTCETLIQAYNNYRIVNKQFADAEQVYLVFQSHSFAC